MVVTYDEAKADEAAAVILEALHQQDARTYNGNSGDMGVLALSTAWKVGAIIRRDERRKLADLLDDNVETLSGFAADKESVVKMIAYMLRLEP